MPICSCTRSRKKWEVLQGTAITVHPAPSSRRASASRRWNTRSRSSPLPKMAAVRSGIWLSDRIRAFTCS